MKERPQCDVGSAKKIGHLFQNSGGLEWKYDAKDMLRYVRNSSTKKTNKMFVSVSYSSNEKNIAKSMTV